LDYSEMRKS